MTRTFIFILVTACFRISVADEVPWPEHPRPDCTRDPWVNLNGTWDFTFDTKNAGEQEQWFVPGKHAFDRKIVVPFPWESKVSGIQDTEYKGAAWYARTINLPTGEAWQERDIWLVVGACDWEASVWINGRPAGQHIGGYVPFDINLSRFAKPGEQVTIIIRAVDLTDPHQPTGKQVHWYTRTSGIWQTVYLEPRGKTFISRFQARPNIREGSVTYNIALNQSDKKHVLTLNSPDNTFPAVKTSVPPGQATTEIKVTIPQPKLWSPDSPVLYPVVMVLAGPDGKILDRLESYFGLREISTAKAPGRDYQYIYLNGQPLYLAGALHQSFHPDGIYNYPDDTLMRSDYELCKRIGINFLRIHIKVPIPRELYWADQLGVLIMQDMPCFWQYNKQAQEWWRQMFESSVERDFNHPSIFSWVLFNETWGLGDGKYTEDRQKWVADMYHLAKKLDPTRLVEDNSPCNYDHVITDINSWHFYINDYAAARKHIQEIVDKTFPGSTFNYTGGHKQTNAPLINSEYGGIGAGSGDQDVGWCFKFLTNELRRHNKICGYIYTELSDIEWEHNGFANYDRSHKEFPYDFWQPGFSLRDLNNPDFVIIDTPPCIELKTGQKFDVPISISHWSGRDGKNLSIQWRTRWIDPLGDWYEDKHQNRPASWKPYQVLEQPPITVEAYPSVLLGVLLVDLCEGDQTIARNYVHLRVDRGPAPSVQVIDANRIALRFSPTDFAEWTYGGGIPTPEGIAVHKVSGQGAGAVEYRLRLPKELALDKLADITFIAELASAAGDKKLSWPARRTSFDYPQTDAQKWPTDINLLLNGELMATQVIEDDPADVRGVLSHLHGQSGAHGYLVRITITGGRLAQAIGRIGPDRILRVRLEVPADSGHPGGLSIYGEGLGTYPVQPTCLLSFREPHGLDPAYSSKEPIAQDRVVLKWTTIMPNADTSGYTWKYTTTKPARNWPATDFDDSQWKTGQAGFGTEGTPNARIGTPWNTSDIWLRTEINVDDPGRLIAARWRLYHDDNVRIYLNNQRALDLYDYTTDYINIPWNEATLKALRPGRNVIAVQCHQNGGGQNIDVGIGVVWRGDMK